MTIKFIVQRNNENDESIEIIMDNNSYIKDLKTKIIEEFNLKCNCIDIYVKTERPIRGMGKYTLEEGILQRSMDNYKMDKFNIENKTLLIDFVELEENYVSENKKRDTVNRGRYIPPRLREKNIDPPKKEIQLDLNDMNEFPPLC